MNNTYFNHIHLLILRLLGISTREENKKSENQFREIPGYQQFLSSLCDPDNYNKRQALLQTIHTEEELARFLKKHRKPVHKLVANLWKAAIVFLFIGIGTCWYIYRHTDASVSSYPLAQTVHPGTQGAVLILSNGHRRQLQKNSRPIVERDGSLISGDSTQLNYTGSGSPADTTVLYNHLLVGRGFEYMLTLQDGTKVWLNSESELYYPVQFSSTARPVKLSGEAYFEVARDTLRPFTVEVNGQFHVNVLGTRFNIKAYPSDGHSETTLIQGKVAVSDPAQSRQAVILQPSEQAVRHNNQEIEVRKVNAAYSIAWHEGWFYFSNEPLEKALEQIGRWYDMDFVFDAPAIRHLMVTGKIKRFENLDVILNMLATTTGCDYKILGKTVEVTKRK